MVSLTSQNALKSSKYLIIITKIEAIIEYQHTAFASSTPCFCPSILMIADPCISSGILIVTSRFCLILLTVIKSKIHE